MPCLFQVRASLELRVRSVFLFALMVKVNHTMFSMQRHYRRQLRRQHLYGLHQQRPDYHQLHKPSDDSSDSVGHRLVINNWIQLTFISYFAYNPVTTIIASSFSGLTALQFLYFTRGIHVDWSQLYRRCDFLSLSIVPSEAFYGLTALSCL